MKIKTTRLLVTFHEESAHSRLGAVSITLSLSVLNKKRRFSIAFCLLCILADKWLIILLKFNFLKSVKVLWVIISKKDQPLVSDLPLPLSVCFINTLIPNN